jgi:hypothetical protein
VTRLRPAEVRFYVDADVLGLGKVIAELRSDATYPVILVRRSIGRFGIAARSSTRRFPIKRGSRPSRNTGG